MKMPRMSHGFIPSSSSGGCMANQLNYTRISARTSHTKSLPATDLDTEMTRGRVRVELTNNARIPIGRPGGSGCLLCLLQSCVSETAPPQHTSGTYNNNILIDQAVYLCISHSAAAAALPLTQCGKRSMQWKWEFYSPPRFICIGRFE